MVLFGAPRLTAVSQWILIRSVRVAAAGTDLDLRRFKSENRAPNANSTGVHDPGCTI
jgi:hypothetical protein